MADESKGACPPWAWVFGATCGIIPLLTLGGAIPGAIGLGGAAACIAVARDGTKSIRARLAICGGITILCWVLLVVLLVGIAFVKR